MGLSETIIAAMIGAGATMATAIFQLIRNRAPVDVRPKKNRVRSLFATIALMIGCIVGGYAWSSLRAVNASEEMRSTLQTEITRQFAALAAGRSDEGDAAGDAHPQDEMNAPVSITHPAGGTAESLARLAPCRPAAEPDHPDATAAPAACSEQSAHAVLLCAALPEAAQDPQLRVMVRTQSPDAEWLTGDLTSSMIGELQVSGPGPDPLPAGTACIQVANWSLSEPLLVRLLADYRLVPATPVPPPPTVVAPITAALQ